MAVTKIRKISSWVLILCTIVTVVVLGLFYFGGDEELYKGEIWNPTHAGTLLYWMYILFAITIAATILFAIWQFIANFKENPKGGMMGLVVIVLFFAMMYITYAVGGDTPLPIMNADAQEFNVPFWLKITDMWLYSTYILTGLVVLAILAGSIKKVLNK